MSLQDVSNTLWRERQLLEMLLFKLEEEQLLLAAGRTRWLPVATREAERVIDEIHETEILRASLVDGVAAQFGLGAEPSLRQLVEVLPSPWSELFDDHRRAFLALTDEVVAVAQANRELLVRASSAAREVLASLGVGNPERVEKADRAEGYGPARRPRVAILERHLLDRAL